ncbi:MAG TPA: hypothetical protein ENJ37_08750 [Deltaproteobacteria bacterium]|nr:hypothetical protein [Deltaproteobacteria bacterium]
MLYRFLTAVVALKVMVLTVWLVSGLAGFDAVEVLAGAPAAGASAEAASDGSHGPDAVAAGPADRATEADGSTVKELVEGSERERTLLDAIKRMRTQLDERERELRTREERLAAFDSEIKARIARLEKVRAEAEAALQRLQAARSEKIARIIKIYEAMSSEEAAERLEELDDDMAVLILASMKPKKAGEVLALVEVKKAVRLTRLMKKEAR